MNEPFRLLVTSGLLGTIVLVIVNIVISVKTLRAQKNLEKYKAYLAFLKEKIDILRNARSSISVLEKTEPYFKAITNDDSSILINLLGEDRSRFLEKINSYEEIRYCFSNSNREKIDELIQRFHSLDSKAFNHIFSNMNKQNIKQKVPQDILETFLSANSAMTEIEKTLIKAIDEELISTAERLSNFS